MLTLCVEKVPLSLVMPAFPHIQRYRHGGVSVKSSLAPVPAAISSSFTPEVPCGPEEAGMAESAAFSPISGLP